MRILSLIAILVLVGEREPCRKKSCMEERNFSYANFRWLNSTGTNDQLALTTRKNLGSTCSMLT